MKSLITVTGTFKNNLSVMDCLGYICRLVPIDKISISDLDSNNDPNTSGTFLEYSEGAFGSLKLVLAGAVFVTGIFFCAYIGNVQLALLLFFLSIIQLPCEARDGEHVRGKVEIAIGVSKLSEQNSIRAIMQEFGAVVTLKALKSDFGQS